MCQECNRISKDSPCLSCRIKSTVEAWEKGFEPTVNESKELVLYKVRNPMKYKIEVPEELRMLVTVKMRSYEKILRKQYEEVETGENVKKPVENQEKKILMSNDELKEVASHAYYAYGKTTNFKNYQGLPMPDFKDLPEGIKNAWLESTRHVVNETMDKIGTIQKGKL